MLYKFAVPRFAVLLLREQSTAAAFCRQLLAFPSSSNFDGIPEKTCDPLLSAGACCT